MIINFDEYIIERKQRGLLYHYTSLHGIAGVLKQNQIGVASHNTSFTRDKHFHKISRSMVSTEVRITVDGDKLTDHYKMRPYSDFPKAKAKVSDGDHYDMRYVESEELVTGRVIDASKYIISIDFIPNNFKIRSFNKFLYNFPEAVEVIGEYKIHSSNKYGYLGILNTDAIDKAKVYLEALYNIKIGIIS